MLDVTIQDLAASTEKSNTAFRSGWSNTAGVRHFELGIQVDVAVGRVDAAVQAFAGVGVLAHRLDGNLVVLLEALQLDAAVHVRFSRVEGFTVEGDFADFVGDEVKEA